VRAVRDSFAVFACNHSDLKVTSAAGWRRAKPRCIGASIRKPIQANKRVVRSFGPLTIWICRVRIRRSVAYSRSRITRFANQMINVMPVYPKTFA
jgi:hypothetical protein